MLYSFYLRILLLPLANRCPGHLLCDAVYLRTFYGAGRINNCECHGAWAFSDRWLKKPSSDDGTQLGEATSQVLESMRSAVEKGQLKAVNDVFFEWALSYQFVQKVLSVVLQPSKPHSSEVVQYLLQSGSISSNMIEGGLLGALRSKADWVATPLASVVSPMYNRCYIRQPFAASASTPDITGHHVRYRGRSGFGGSAGNAEGPLEVFANAEAKASKEAKDGKGKTTSQTDWMQKRKRAHEQVGMRSVFTVLKNSLSRVHDVERSAALGSRMLVYSNSVGRGLRITGEA
ncbi:Mitochondrial genome maintenance protein [Salix suchowensis]|nr:Mitochondrial genome maintenance protein [Salix suchowensis]